MLRRNKSFFRHLGRGFYALFIILVIIGVIVTLELTNTTHLFHKSKVPSVIPVSGNSNDSSTSNSSTEQKEPTTSPTTNPTSLPLRNPYGDFVSNHHPNLNGSPAPSKETSVCNTTPGATCYISFTKGSVTTKLPAEKTDSKGVAYWTWDVKKAGLTPGVWTITAVATLNGQNKSTMDPIPLTVKQ